jgi:D-psicose/D-tagatose/L-ribulose 3-epimerase
MTVHPARRLTISNIAWEPREDDAVAAILRGEGVGGVEIAPTKWREQPLEATEAEVAAYRRAWEDRGLRITSLQALFFGKPELQLFGDAATRTAMADHLRGMIDLAARLGARSLVFGSPKNRVRGSLPLAAATEVAKEFLREIGVYAASRDTVVCIEANPRAYGCDFVTTTAQAVDLCRGVDHPGVRVNGDLGGMTLAGEDPAEAIVAAGGMLAHFHASEPYLAVLSAGVGHARAAQGLKSIAYDEWVSIEMRAGERNRNAAAVKRAVEVAMTEYAPFAQ